MRLPILVLHIFGGTLGILSGFLAAFLPKGSRSHAIAGDVFVVSMLTMACAGTTLAVMKAEPGNILGGTFTFYLVATAWMTARRSEHGISRYDWAGLAAVFAVAASEMVLGTRAEVSPTGMVYGYPPGPYFFIGSVALLAFVGDIRLLSRKGIGHPAHSASSVADVLWSVYRLRVAVFGPTTVLSAMDAEVGHAYPAQFPAANSVDLLADSGAVWQWAEEKINRASACVIERPLVPREIPERGSYSRKCVDLICPDCLR